MKPPRATTDDRSWQLKIVIFLLALANLFGLLKGLTSQAEFLSRYPRLLGLWPLYLLSPVLTLVSLVGIWYWRRRGVWLCLAIFALICAIEFYALGIGVHLVRLPIALGLLLVVIWPVWRKFR